MRVVYSKINFFLNCKCLFLKKIRTHLDLLSIPQSGGKIVGRYSITSIVVCWKILYSINKEDEEDRKRDARKNGLLKYRCMQDRKRSLMPHNSSLATDDFSLDMQGPPALKESINYYCS